MNANNHGEHGELDRPAADAEHRLGVGRDESRCSAGADDQGQGTGATDQVTDKGPESGLCISEYTAGTGQGSGEFGDTQGQPPA
ncbi:hypothetical protein D9M73_218440 [compost metagenome]